MAFCRWHSVVEKQYEYRVPENGPFPDWPGDFYVFLLYRHNRKRLAQILRETLLDSEIEAAGLLDHRIRTPPLTDYAENDGSIVGEFSQLSLRVEFRGQQR